MAKLEDVLSAIISQISMGRSQADMATLEVATIYKDHPILSGLPVPRMTLDEVIIDLKMSITTASDQKTIAAEPKKEISHQLYKLVDNLIVSESSLIDLNNKFPDIQTLWKTTRQDIMQKLHDLLPVEIEIEPKTISYSIASTILTHLIYQVFKDAKVTSEESKFFLENNIQSIKKRLVSLVFGIISDFLKSQPVDNNRLDVLVTASDLQSIPPEKITNLKLTLREADQEWTQIETENGEIKSKLIPR